jgi:glyoxylase-like metal-dependent hydrolase (beta-lactamase superfamily II)
MGPKSKRDNSNLKIVEKSDHSVITLGSISITVIHTPGHTLESTCYLLTDTKGKQTCLFTGDTIFLN